MEEIETNSDDFGKLSRINSAGLVNSMLSNLWQDFFRHFRSGEYLAANCDLDCVWTILGGEKEIEGGETEGNYLDIDKQLSESGSLVNSLEIKGFGKINREQLERAMRQKAILLKKSLFLRRIQNRQGKGTAYHDEDEGDFD